MSQPEDEPSSLPELTLPRPESPLILPPCCEDEASDPSSSNRGLSEQPSVQIDNFVTPDPNHLEAIHLCVESSPAAAEPDSSIVIAASALDADDSGPDDSSSAVAACSPAPLPTSASPNSESDVFEQQRLQLLREVQERALAIEKALEEERDREHSIMLLALQRRKSGESRVTTSDDNDSIGDGAVKDPVGSNFLPPRSSTISQEGPAAESDAESDKGGCSNGSAAQCNQTENLANSIPRSRSSSPEPSIKQGHCSDIRIDILPLQPVVPSEIEPRRNQSFARHWQSRQQNVDAVLYAQLAEMGFDSRISIVALERTGSASLQEAIDFCLDHGNEEYSGALRSDAGDSDNSSTADISVNLACLCSKLFSRPGSCMTTGATAKMKSLQNLAQRLGPLQTMTLNMSRSSFACLWNYCGGKCVWLSIFYLDPDHSCSGEGPRTVSGRGLFVDAGGSAAARPGSAYRHAFVAGKLRQPRNFRMRDAFLT